MNRTAAWLLVIVFWTFLWIHLQPNDIGLSLLFASIAFFGWLFVVPRIHPDRPEAEGFTNATALLAGGTVSDKSHDTLYHATVHPPQAATNLWSSDFGGFFRVGAPGSFISCDVRPLSLEAKKTYTVQMWVLKRKASGLLMQWRTKTGNPWEMRATANGFALSGNVDVPAKDGEWVHLTLVRKANGSGDLYRQGTHLRQLPALPSGNDIVQWTLLGPETADGVTAPAAGDAPGVGRMVVHRDELSPSDILEWYLSTARRFGALGDPDRKPSRTSVVCELDASVSASYPGRGPVWYDLQWFEAQRAAAVATAPPSTALDLLRQGPSPYTDMARQVIDKVVACAKP